MNTTGTTMLAKATRMRAKVRAVYLPRFSVMGGRS
jgi:hypothetical protein